MAATASRLEASEAVAAVRPEQGSPAPPATILLAVHQGFSQRYLLQTDILPRLTDEARVVVLAPADEVAGLAAAMPAGVVVEAAPAQVARGRLLRWLFLLRWFMPPGFVSTSREVFRRELNAVSSLRGRLGLHLLFGLARILSLAAPLRRLVPWLEGRLAPGHAFDGVLARHQPSLVVVSSLGDFGFDAELLRSAQRHRIPGASVILSWDNVTSKPYPAAHPDQVIAWTETMKADLVRLTDIPAPAVTVCGIAHFDVYHQPDPGFDRAAVVAALGLDPAKRLITFATKSPNSYRWNPNLAQAIAEAIARGDLPDAQLAIRVHPIHYREAGGVRTYTAVLDAYADLCRRYPFVVLSEPVLAEGSGRFAMQPQEMTNLARLLRASDVVVNLFSTVNLEGALLDRPLVNACFEFEEPLSRQAHRSRFDIRSDLAEDHNLRIVDSGGVAMAYSAAGMIAHIRRYLDTPAADAEGRRLIATREGGPNPGRAGIAVAERLLFDAVGGNRR